MCDDDEIVPVREGMVFPVWHFCHQAGEHQGYSMDKGLGQQPRRIGVFSTHERAVAAIRRYLDLPGFRDWPNSFKIYREPLDDTAWEEGFVGWWEDENE